MSGVRDDGWCTDQWLIDRLKCRWCTHVGLAGYASWDSCASCVLFVSGSGQTVLQVWRQHPVLCLDFSLLLLLTPEGSGICLPLALPFKGCIHCKQALENRNSHILLWTRGLWFPVISIGISLFILGGFVIKMWDSLSLLLTPFIVRHP